MNRLKIDNKYLEIAAWVLSYLNVVMCIYFTVLNRSITNIVYLVVDLALLASLVRKIPHRTWLACIYFATRLAFAINSVFIHGYLMSSAQEVINYVSVGNFSYNAFLISLGEVVQMVVLVVVLAFAVYLFIPKEKIISYRVLYITVIVWTFAFALRYVPAIVLLIGWTPAMIMNVILSALVPIPFILLSPQINTCIKSK